MNPLESIQSIRFFQGLPEDICARIADISVIQTAPKDTLLFEADAPANGFFGVISGRVKIFRTSPSGKEHILHVFGPGEVFGEVPVFQGGTFPASAQTLEESQTAFFPRRDFTTLIQNDPDMAMKMLALLSGRLRTLVNKVDDLSLKETPTRVAAYLLLLRSSQDSDTFKLDLPKGQIAFYLGTIQETLSRIFKRFSEEGTITINGSQITIHDMARLKEIAEEGR